ncbi:MAG: hypothetical protein DRI94_08025 [Bacteroidetes bacterium]|nr:MAG: hypothetical protein DRI94_08025 [Bacteroidota bacterium]
MKKGLLLILAVVFAFNVNAQIFSDDFQDGDMSDWLTVSPNYAAQPYNWHISDYSGDYYMSVACFDGINNATVQWAVSPAFDATGISDISITLDNRGRYNPYQNIEVYVSTDFAGDSASFDAATWTQVTGFTWDDSYDDYDWVLATSASATISGTANTYIAFKYVSIDGDDSSGGGNWTINNVVVSNNATDISKVSDNLRIFPNPAINDLNISSVSNINNITVSNVIGQTVLSFNDINTDHFTVNVADLTKGVYLINIKNADGTSAITKFVKK